MRRRALFILILLVLVAGTVFFCGRRCEHDVPVVNIDSLFIDLNKEIVAKRAKMADKMFTNMCRAGLNGVVLYAEQGEVIYEKAFGWRDLNKRHKDSLRIDDAFQLSSDSKMFTAEAVMLLNAQGKLNYDDDVRKYIPELPYEGVTIRMLLTHRSGLRRKIHNPTAHLMRPISITTSTMPCWHRWWSVRAASISRTSCAKTFSSPWA